MSPTAMRRGVVARAPMVDVLARTSTSLCAADDDGYEAPKIEFDPDADVGGRDLYGMPRGTRPLREVILSSSAETVVTLHAIERRRGDDVASRGRGA